MPQNSPSHFEPGLSHAGWLFWAGRSLVFVARPWIHRLGLLCFSTVGVADQRTYPADNTRSFKKRSTYIELKREAIAQLWYRLDIDLD